MKSFPQSAFISVPPELAAALVKVTKTLPQYDDTALRSPALQATLREQIRACCSEGFDWLIEEIGTRLKKSPFCACVKGLVFDDSNLLFAGIASTFGELVEPNRQPWSQLIRPIQPGTDRQEPGYGLLNEQLHTDGTDWQAPNDLTCLLCIRPDQLGRGKTLLLDLEDLLREMELRSNSDTIQRLRKTQVPWQLSDAMGGRVIWAPVFSTEGIRYMRYTIDLAVQRLSIKLAPEMIEALTILDSTIECSRNLIGLMLYQNDLLLVNNKRCLHARAKISGSEASSRLMLRLKVAIPK